MKNLELIVAMGLNREIGRNQELIWRIREDLEFFKNTTMNSYIIMGKNTYLSMPKSLKGRSYIILSRNKDFECLPGQIKFPDVYKTLKFVESKSNSRFLVVGGGQIYELFLPYVDKMHITEIEDVCSNADTFFPLFNLTEWNKEIVKDIYSEEDNLHYKHTLYLRK